MHGENIISKQLYLSLPDVSKATIYGRLEGRDGFPLIDGLQHLGTKVSNEPPIVLSRRIPLRLTSGRSQMVSGETYGKNINYIPSF